MFLHFGYLLHNGDVTCMDVVNWICQQFASSIYCLYHVTKNDDDFGFFPIISCKFCTYMKVHCVYDVVDVIGLIINVS
jgi:hypothetical protein